MKKIILIAILLVSIKVADAQVKFEALQLTPQMPKAGQTVSFKFNSKLSSLIDEKKAEILVYLFSENGSKILEPKILQTGAMYSGNFKLDSNTACIAFGISANDKKAKDNNAGNGYIVPVYTKSNKPVMEYYTWAARLYNGYGEDYFGMKTDFNKALALIEESVQTYPGIKNNVGFYFTYLNSVSSAKKKEGEPVILQSLKEIASKPGIVESDYAVLTQWYTKLKMKSTADSFSVIMKEKYPAGDWKKNEMGTAITKSKGAENKKTAFEAYLKAYPPKKEDRSTINYYRGHVASAFHKEKNYEMFKALVKELPMADKASLYNNLSWYMAEAKENLNDAKLISYEATAWAKKEMTTPSEKKPDYLTKKDWAQQRKYEYGMYADTYAFILYQSGDFKNGYQYAKEAVKITNNAEYIERYVQLMVKVTPPAMAKKEIEKFVEDGVASSKTKELLKELYVKEKGSEAGYKEYITKLEMTAKEKKREELAKTMINEEAPKFNLRDLEGNDISLVSLKGKVVIVDFWATWCGPCIASMPAMKTAQEKLKGNDVAFVFVDTWESAENQKENAADFMKKNEYPFHVLLDDESRVVAEYKVNGIPTKFVIDKTGNIRFKSVGFSGNDDALVDEVSMMVEMASADMPVRKYVK